MHCLYRGIFLSQNKHFLKKCKEKKLGGSYHGPFWEMGNGAFSNPWLGSFGILFFLFWSPISPQNQVRFRPFGIIETSIVL